MRKRLAAAGAGDSSPDAVADAARGIEAAGERSAGHTWGEGEDGQGKVRPVDSRCESRHERTRVAIAVRILFFLDNVAKTRHFENVLALLADRGHSVVLAAARQRNRPVWLPKTLIQVNDRLIARRLQAEHLEELRGDGRRLGTGRFPTAEHGGGAPKVRTGMERQGFEAPRLLLPILEVGPGDVDRVSPLGELPQRHDAVRVIVVNVFPSAVRLSVTVAETTANVDVAGDGGVADAGTAATAARTGTRRARSLDMMLLLSVRGSLPSFSRRRGRVNRRRLSGAQLFATLATPESRRAAVDFATTP